MKRIFLFYIMAIMAISMSAQNDVTTFLGIPVDGFKSEMKQKLVSKGFVPKKVGTNEFLEGEFNGTDVHVYIATNNNKVYRIMLCDANTQNEANIKIRFNKLVSQFENNKRYTSLDKYTLSDEENISYEMTVNKKNYGALFYQNPDFENIHAKIQIEIKKKYSDEELKNPSDTVKNDIKAITHKCFDCLWKKPVWFTICKSYGEYYISMYYDNEYNKANGEDL